MPAFCILSWSYPTPWAGGQFHGNPGANQSARGPAIFFSSWSKPPPVWFNKNCHNSFKITIDFATSREVPCNISFHVLYLFSWNIECSSSLLLLHWYRNLMLFVWIFHWTGGSPSSYMSMPHIIWSFVTASVILIWSHVSFTSKLLLGWALLIEETGHSPLSDSGQGFDENLVGSNLLFQLSCMSPGGIGRVMEWR